jgi:hypothetical protein
MENKNKIDKNAVSKFSRNTNLKLVLTNKKNLTSLCKSPNNTHINLLYK